MSMGGGGHSTTTTTQELSPEQRQLMQGVLPIAQDFLKNPPKQYPGSGIVGFNPLQTQAQTMTMNAANAMLPFTQQIPGQMNALNQGYQNLGGQFGQNAGAFGQNAGAFGGNAQAFGQNAQAFNPTINAFGQNAGAFGQNAQAFGQNAQGFNQVGQFGQQAIGSSQQGMGNAQGIQGQINNMIQGVQGGTNFLTSGDVLNANSNPYLQQAIQAAARPTIENFERSILPGIQLSGIESGGFGGTRSAGIASGLAAQGATNAIADQAAAMSNTNYQAGLQAMLGGLQAAQGQRGDVLAGGNLAQQAAGQLAQTQLGAGTLQNQSLIGQTGALQGQTGALQGVNQSLAGQTGALQGQTGALQGQTGALAGQTGALQGQTQALTGQANTLAGQSNLLQNTGSILGQTLLPAKLTEAVGTQQHALAQQQLSEQVQRYINQQMIPFSAAQDVAAMAFGMPGGTTRSESTGGQQGGAGQIIGGALSVLPMLFGKSDRRLKKDIIAIGKENGLTLYSFRYRGTDIPMIGFMADEVEELYPEMVTYDVTGYKGVRYGEMQWSTS